MRLGHIVWRDGEAHIVWTGLHKLDQVSQVDACVDVQSEARAEETRRHVEMRKQWIAARKARGVAP